MNGFIIVKRLTTVNCVYKKIIMISEDAIDMYNIFQVVKSLNR